MNGIQSDQLELNGVVTSYSTKERVLTLLLVHNPLLLNVNKDICHLKHGISMVTTLQDQTMRMID